MRATESYSKKRRTQAANARSRTRLQTAKDAGNTKRNRQFSNPVRLCGAWTLREFREFSRIPNWRPLALIRVRVFMCSPPPGFEQEETEGTEWAVANGLEQKHCIGNASETGIESDFETRPQLIL